MGHFEISYLGLLTIVLGTVLFTGIFVLAVIAIITSGKKYDNDIFKDKNEEV